MQQEVLGMFDLAGQVAVVTGALGRLGREYVKTLAGAGASVGAIDIAGDASAFAALTARGQRVDVELADLSKKDATDRAIAAIVRALGAPSILVNNAGTWSSPAAAGNENGPFEDYSEAAWDTMIDPNQDHASRRRSATSAAQADRRQHHQRVVDLRRGVAGSIDL
jgi:3-oxoacyl-[acyl-carrier protein] reductase